MNEKSAKRNNKTSACEEKCTLPARVSRFLDVPSDMLLGGCYLEMHGQNHLRLQGCKRILCYTSEEIVLGLRRGRVRIRGRDLVCISYHAGWVIIEGWVCGVDLQGTEVGR